MGSMGADHDLGAQGGENVLAALDLFSRQKPGPPEPYRNPQAKAGIPRLLPKYSSACILRCVMRRKMIG